MGLVNFSNPLAASGLPGVIEIIFALFHISSDADLGVEESRHDENYTCGACLTLITKVEIGLFGLYPFIDRPGTNGKVVE